MQGLMEKLQAREKRVNEIQKDAGAQAFFSKQNGSGYFQKGRGHEQTKGSGTRWKFRGGGYDSLCMKRIGRLVTLTVAIQDLGLTNQKLNAIMVKKKM